MIFREGEARRRRTSGKAKRAHPKGHSTTILGEATLGMAALPPSTIGAYDPRHCSY